MHGRTTTLQQRHNNTVNVVSFWGLFTPFTLSRRTPRTGLAVSSHMTLPFACNADFISGTAENISPTKGKSLQERRATER